MALRKEGFWDEHYGLELRNYEEDGDEGDVWFGKGLSRRIVTWILDRIKQQQQQQQQQNSGRGLGAKVIDVGCGNSFTLCTLVEKHNQQTMSLKDKEQLDDHTRILGIDYSTNSIDLSRKIVATRGLSKTIDLKQCDFLDLNQLGSVAEGNKFDYIIDIGTFDAICLLASGKSESATEEAKLKYMESLYSLARVATIFILASCNHTEQELLPLFELQCSSRLNSHLIDRIETPRIQFGGVEGSQVTCIIMEFTG